MTPEIFNQRFPYRRFVVITTAEKKKGIRKILKFELNNIAAIFQITRQ